MSQPSKKPVSFIKAILSVLSAAIGVQKRENMERDLNASNPKVYVVAGLIFLMLFVGSIYSVVRLVIPS